MKRPRTVGTGGVGALCNPVSATRANRTGAPQCRPWAAALRVPPALPLKIASPPERRTSLGGGRTSVQLWRAAVDSVVSLPRTAEYQNKGARRAVAAPARRPAGVAGRGALHALTSVRVRTALIEVVRCELGYEV